MKTISALMLSAGLMLSASAFAQGGAAPAATAPTAAAPVAATAPTATASTTSHKDRKVAKTECLAENKDLRGKKLKQCIQSKIQ